MSSVSGADDPLPLWRVSFELNGIHHEALVRCYSETTARATVEHLYKPTFRIVGVADARGSVVRVLALDASVVYSTAGAPPPRLE